VNLVIEHVCNDCGGLEVTEHDVPSNPADWRWGFVCGLSTGLVFLAATVAGFFLRG
jgi:hypothetical protein